jgi:hypothetical protein
MLRIPSPSALSAVCVVVVATAAAPAPASDSRPFHGHFAVMETKTLDPACGAALRIRHTGPGTATGLGPATWSGMECSDLLAMPGRVHVRDGRAVLTSSTQGDEIRVSYTADGELPDLAGNVHVTGPFTITGGTGRFSRATGGGTFTGDANVNRPDATIDMTGRLSNSEDDD